MGHVGEQKPCENGVFENGNVDFKRMGHVGEQKPCENGLFGNENGDVIEDLAFQGCRNQKIRQKNHEFR